MLLLVVCVTSAFTVFTSFLEGTKRIANINTTEEFYCLKVESRLVVVWLVVLWFILCMYAFYVNCFCCAHERFGLPGIY